MKKLIILLIISAYLLPLNANAQTSCLILHEIIGFHSDDEHTKGEVSKLQNFLKTKGYFKGEVSGFYGEDMAEAVIDFKKDNGIAVFDENPWDSSIVGQKVHDKIASLTCKSAVINAVSEQVSQNSTSEINRLNDFLNQKVTTLGKQGLNEQESPDVKNALEKRRDLMLDLAKKNPSLFLNSVLPKTTLSALSIKYKDYIEEEITGVVTIDVVHYDNFEHPEKTHFEYFVTVPRNSSSRITLKSLYSSPVTDRLVFYPTSEIHIMSDTKVSLKGYRLQNLAAGNTNPGSGFELIQAPKPDSIGDQKTLFLLINFTDSPPKPFTRKKAEDIFFSGPFNKFYKEQSYGKVSFSGDVYGWIDLSRGTEECNNISLKDTVISKYIIDNKIDLGRYDRLVYAINPTSCPGFSGYSGVGKSKVDFNGKSYFFSETLIANLQSYTNQNFDNFEWSSLDYVLAHEIGHSLGVDHANGWDCHGDSLYGNCEHIEYGNPFDTMGGGWHSLHFNVFYKNILGWLSPEQLVVANKSGQYSISPLEQGLGVLGILLNDPVSGKPYLALEYRKGFGFDQGLSNTLNPEGLLINKIVQTEGRSFVRLLDMSPSSEDSVWFLRSSNSSLNGNNIFVDIDNGITIGPISSYDDKKITFDVKITDPKCIVRPPIIQYLYVDSDYNAGGRTQLSFTVEQQSSSACNKINPKSFVYTLEGVAENWKLIMGESISSGEQKTNVNGDIFIPSNAKPGNYDIKLILSIGGKKVAEESFSVRVDEPSISVLSPSFEDVVEKGKSYIIKYKASGVAKIRIDLMDFKGIYMIKNIEPSLERNVSGEYHWDVSRDIDLRRDNLFTIRISDINNSKIFGKSGKFTISEKVVMNGKASLELVSQTPAIGISVRELTKPSVSYSTGRNESIIVSQGSDIELKWLSGNASSCSLIEAEAQIPLSKATEGNNFLQKNLIFPTYQYKLTCGSLTEAVNVIVVKKDKAGLVYKILSLLDPSPSPTPFSTLASTPTPKITTLPSVSVSPSTSASPSPSMSPAPQASVNSGTGTPSPTVTASPIPTTSPSPSSTPDMPSLLASAPSVTGKPTGIQDHLYTSTITITSAISNTGKASSPSSTAYFQLSTNNNSFYDWVPISLPAIPAGSSYNASYTWNGGAGIYYFRTKINNTYFASTTVTIIAEPTPSSTPIPTFSPSPSPSVSASPLVSPSISASPSPSVSASPSTSISPSVSASPSVSVSPSPSPSASASISVSPSASVSPSPSMSPAPQASVNSGTGTPSPSPSGSGVSQANGKSLLASTFYAIGDFLDELFSK